MSRVFAFIVALVLALPTSAQSFAEEPTPNPTVWPECAPGQIEVMLLGSAHLANHNLDAHNVDVPDVRTPARQADLQDLTDRLALYAPQKVMVEAEWHAERAAVDSSYAAYLASGGQTESRSEIEQIGFRLARDLGHSRVHSIDSRRFMDYSGVRQFVAEGGQIKHTMDYNAMVPERLRVDEDSLIRSLSLTEYYAWLNDDTALRGNHFGMFAGLLGAGADDNYAGPDEIAGWYSRNLKMVHHILREVEVGDERVLVIVGGGHVRAMRHFLDEAPHFCPTSPLPYLASDA